MNLPEQNYLEEFDFANLKNVQLAIKQDVGASSYWSEMANVQTLENLLMNGHIDAVQFLERIPSGYVAKKQELIQQLKAAKAGLPQVGGAGGMGTGMSMETSDQMAVAGGSGNGALQRAINREGV